jgi:Domain of unknown function (DUF397)
MSTDTPWIKARRSGNSGNCAEMRAHAGAVEIRDSKANGEGPTLGFTKAEFAAWLDGAKNGDFDHLASS